MVDFLEKDAYNNITIEKSKDFCTGRRCGGVLFFLKKVSYHLESFKICSVGDSLILDRRKVWVMPDSKYTIGG